MRTRLAATSLALAAALTAGVAVPAAFAATGAGTAPAETPVATSTTVKDILGRLPDGVIAGAVIRHDGKGAAAGPVTADAHFRIGSVTKTFTNTVVLQLVAEHRIALDAPARRYLPELLPEAYDGVTVRQLLDHTSGFPRPARTPGPYDGPGWQFKSVKPEDSLRESFAAAAAANVPPPAPGSEQQYNGLNSLALGLLVEKVTGRSFAGELERRIIRPLHLRRTSLPAADDLRIPSPHATVYAAGQDVTEQSPYPWAEGGMISTAADLDRFFTALFRGRLLPPAQQKLVFDVPNVKSSADNRNCLGGPACFSVGGLMRYKLNEKESAWGKTGSRPGWDNGFFATKDLRHRVVYSLNTTGSGDVLKRIQDIVGAALTD
ncbi:serine hydrolase [Streptomyces sp. NBC_00572]|uniref:serine hydrolase domain-containing protein n=1 Tax=Streptomyces sp. NBC_00572 TaxID=2903664 RepID=UPI0022505AF3|nr:serine hydrolase domain-containing protein [Streptomyces sp. NBC_00572]MCX4982529.1 beta-lactamase family protein [Streptomyces sp. NBC_00572]